MKAQRYIVIGQYNSERNSYVPGGDIRHVCSAHRTERAAWLVAPRHDIALGGCDGSDSLTRVMQRFARSGSKRANVLRSDETADSYEHAGWIYCECDYWAAHQVVFAGQGPAAVLN